MRAARGARYGKGMGYRAVAGPPMPDPSAPPRKSKVHSILGALPVIMLVSGLYFFYSGESEQSAGGPILAESVEVSAAFEGLSVVRSGGEGRHYLWFDDGGRRRGARIPPARRAALDGLEPGDRLRLRLAPTVSGSRTLWAWRVEHEGAVLVDDSARLR